nr:very short patch repair endonuclease [Mycolicibacterium porcinum]
MTESWASSAATRASMRANRRRDTAPELAVRRLAHAAGLRYRVDYPPLASHRRLRADMVFTRARIAVFIDGCFWHGCPAHLYPPKSNVEYWTDKIEGNQARDRRTNELLRETGWTVLRFWEHEDPAAIAARILRTVTDARDAER